MSDIELPALPNLDVLDYIIAEKMREFACAAVLMERERCAALCEKVAYEDWRREAVDHQCAAAIRNQGKPTLQRLLDETPKGV